MNCDFILLLLLVIDKFYASLNDFLLIYDVCRRNDHQRWLFATVQNWSISCSDTSATDHFKVSLQTVESSLGYHIRSKYFFCYYMSTYLCTSMHIHVHVYLCVNVYVLGVVTGHKCALMCICI